MALFFDQGDKLSKFGSDMNKNPNYDREVVGFSSFFFKRQDLGR
jgi:hypothetical protein